MNNISRRDFIKLSAYGFGLLFFRKDYVQLQDSNQWPSDMQLGRFVDPGNINMYSKPTVNSTVISTHYQDSVFIWEREILGESAYGFGRKWVQTPDGYLYAPYIQPVRYIPNPELSSLPVTSDGNGMWVEVTVPYVDLILQNPPARSEWTRNTANPRLYYEQIVWVDEISNINGIMYYRINEKKGSPGDIFWARSAAFRQLTENDFSEISPQIENKKIVVSLPYQTLRCYEDGREIYFCQCSTGAMFDVSGIAVDAWSTPPGEHPTFLKYVSLHMSGNSSGAGWDTPGVGWTNMFAAKGIAIHSTFWHNKFGTPVSHGCVNVSCKDAHWIFRWTNPFVDPDPGYVDIAEQKLPWGTIVDVQMDT